MACLAEKKQVLCDIPEGSRGLEAYVTSEQGIETRVCRWSSIDGLKCVGYNGFTCQVLNQRKLQITLSESYESASWTFRCRIQGANKSDIQTCQWTPTEYNIASSTSSSTQRTTEKMVPVQDSLTNENRHKQNITITALCALPFIIFVIIFIIIAVRRKRSRKEIIQSNQDAAGSNEDQPIMPLMQTAYGNRSREQPSDLAQPVPIGSTSLPVPVKQQHQKKSSIKPMTLLADQNALVNSTLPRVFITGPPGTGKSTVLLLKGEQWMRDGQSVYIVSTCERSREACEMLHEKLQQTLILHQDESATPRNRLGTFDLTDDRNVEKAVKTLTEEAAGGPLYVIADEAGPDDCLGFKTFCQKLLAKVPETNLWAASRDAINIPDGWIHRPLRTRAPYHSVPSVESEPP